MTLVGVDTFDLDDAEASSADDDMNIVDVVITIEKKLAAIVPTKQDPTAYTSLTYSEAAEKYPLMFRATADGFQLLEKSALTEDSSVLFVSLAFMDRAQTLFQSLEHSDLKSYYSFLYAHAFAPYLGDDFVQAYFDFFGKTLRGQQLRSKREIVCADVAVKFFPDLVGKYFFLKVFDVERDENVQRMVSAIEKAMGEHIASLEWLEDTTRIEAAAKLAKITNLIGRSKEKVDYSLLLSRENYLHNVQTIKTQAWHSALAKIDKPIDRTEWRLPASSVNAYYSPSANQIAIPAGILQAPFFSAAAHPVQNFGALGAVIGHELTHGFDPSERRYDGDGKKRDWWTKATSEEFERRAMCLEQQYSKMVAYGDSGKPVGYVNGSLTVADNIADNGGVSLALDAYRNWVKTGATMTDAHGVGEDEVEQLFFVSFAQIWCGRIRDSAQKKLLTTDLHAPKPARVLGVAMNSVAFAEAFRCEAGSRMNPTTKCQLW